jgi:ATP-binding cassette, subfamily B, bacterial
VGENGSGKTTLVKLLCRFYDPVKGKITIDGIDLRRMASTDVQRQISVIFQDYGHYPFTARENIRFGDLAAPASGEEIEAAARRAGADGFIRKLPNGYETILCNWFKAGEEISMGEWQKVALARTLFRDAQIIVLDEPTSCMDAKSEYSLFCKLRELAAERILILISHRLQNVRVADRVLVLIDGRVAEQGAHAQLLRQGGKYAELFASQAGAGE